jgi:hypothetical protein
MKKTFEKVEHRIGDIKVVEFVKNRIEGRKPVCMVDGVVAFVDRGYRGQFIEEHSIWHVEINRVNERSLVVSPIQEIKTAFENLREIKERMKLLETKHREKPVVKKVTYSYKSGAERR